MIINGQRSHLGARLYQRKEDHPQRVEATPLPDRPSAEPGYEVVWYPHRDAPSLFTVRAGWINNEEPLK